MNQKPNHRITFVLMGMLIAVSGAFFAFSQNFTVPASETSSEKPFAKWEGQNAPDFTLTDLNQKSVTLQQLKGKLIFLNFWASWCEPCKEEMPSMQRLYDKFKGQPFEMLAISLDKDGDNAIHQFMKTNQLKLSFPILKDPQEKVSKKLYRITGVPESFIIAPDGVILKHVIGSFVWDSPQIFGFFQKLLKDNSR